MKQLIRFATKPWFKIYSRLKDTDTEQTQDQAINRLLSFYLSSIILAFLLTALAAWRIPAISVDKENITAVLALLIAAASTKLSYDFVRDVIATEVDAAIRKVKKEEVLKILDDLQKVRHQIDSSTIKHNLDSKYLSHLQQILGPDNLQLHDISPKLKEACAENRLAFEGRLEEEYREGRSFREARCIIHLLPSKFFQQLAVKGIADGLRLTIKEVNERTKAGNDLHPLRVDIHAYLSAWLVCSLDNDHNILMPLAPIGMRYKDREIPQKGVYKDIIAAIENTIVSGEYIRFRHYPSSDPLKPIEVREAIVNRLHQIHDLIDSYSHAELYEA